MIHIFQIVGKLEYQEKEFLIDDGCYRSYLSSDALRRHLSKSNETNLTLFVPESLLLEKSDREFNQAIKEKGITNFSTVKIPSIGKYMANGKATRFVTGIESITTFIFTYLAKTRPEKIYADVSTGQNVYSISMLEAIKRYITYRKLESLLQGDASIEANTLFPPPITKEVQRYPVEIHPIEAKAFFSLPNSDVDRLYYNAPETLKAKVPEINKKYSDLKKEVRKLVKELRIAYNAIRFNVPLAFYQLLKMDFQTNKIERKLFKLIDELLKPVKTKDSVERIFIDGVNVSNISYSIALYKSIQRFKRMLSESEISDILKKFSNLYRMKNLGVGVNEYFLQRDVDDIMENAEKLNEGEEKLYGLLKKDKLRQSKVAKRNFFAHSGFLQEYTLLKKKKGKVYARWLPERIREIKSWLEDPCKG